MTIAIIAFVVSLLAAGILALRAKTNRMRHFYGRRCTRGAWLERFPQASADEIRGFLEFFVQSFGLTMKKNLPFKPDDKIMDIYRAINPRPGGSDALECETLFADCEKHYGVDITSGFCESTTLGDIFLAVQNEPNKTVQRTRFARC